MIRLSNRMFFFFEFSFHLFQSICLEAFPRFRWYIFLTKKSRVERRENFNFPVTNLASINLQNRASRVENEPDDFPPTKVDSAFRRNFKGQD